MVWDQYSRVDMLTIPSNVCDGPCGVYSYVCPSIVRELHFRHFSCGTNSTKVSIWNAKYFNIVVRVLCCPPRQKVHENNTILIPFMLFANCQHTFKFFLGFLVWCHSLIGAGIWVQNSGPRFRPSWHCVTRSSHIKFLYWCKRSVVTAVLVSLCASLSYLWHWGGGGKPWNSQALQ